MKLSKIFRKAAELCDSGDIDGACFAIAVACSSKNLFNIVEYFDGIFQQSGFQAYYFRYENGGYPYELIEPKEMKKRRVIALLLASEIAKSEGL